MTNSLRAYPGFVLRQAASARMGELARRLEPLQLRISEASTLHLIARHPGLSQSDIGRMIDVKRANMNPMVMRLEARELLSRAQAPGRRQGLFLTPDGQIAAVQVDRIFAEHETALIARVPQDLRPHLMPILNALWATTAP